MALTELLKFSVTIKETVSVGSLTKLIKLVQVMNETAWQQVAGWPETVGLSKSTSTEETILSCTMAKITHGQVVDIARLLDQFHIQIDIQTWKGQCDFDHSVSHLEVLEEKIEKMKNIGSTYSFSKQ
jgi:hypothetical protein